MCTFYERASQQTQEPCLGLKLALSAKPDFSSIGPEVYIGSIAEDMRHLLNMTAEYQKIRTNGVTYSIVEDTSLNEVQGFYDISPNSAPHRQLMEHTIGVAALTARNLFPNFEVKYVSFQHSAPSDTSLYDTVFGAPVKFNASETVLAAEMSVLEYQESDFAAPFRNYAIQAFFDGRIAENAEAKRSVSSFIETIMPAVIGTNLSDINSFAKSLAIHPKKFSDC